MVTPQFIICISVPIFGLEIATFENLFTFSCWRDTLWLP